MALMLTSTAMRARARLTDNGIVQAAAAGGSAYASYAVLQNVERRSPSNVKFARIGGMLGGGALAAFASEDIVRFMGLGVLGGSAFSWFQGGKRLFASTPAPSSPPAKR